MTRGKRITTAAAAIAGVLLALLAMSPLFVPMSPVTSGLVLGIVAVICLGGVAFGIWDARRIDAKRKAKEQIWLKH